MTLGWNTEAAAPSIPAPTIPSNIPPIVTPTDYRAVFGAGSDITQDFLDRATAKCEEALLRPLRNAIYTNRVRIYYDGYVDAVFGAAGAGFPPAIPIQQVITPAGTQLIDNIEVRYLPPDDIMLGFWGYTWIEQYGTVTYQGGWTSNNLPEALREMICKVANRLQSRATPGDGMDPPIPGANSPHLGDVSYTTDDKYGGLFDADDEKTIKLFIYRYA